MHESIYGGKGLYFDHANWRWKEFVLSAAIRDLQRHDACYFTAYIADGRSVHGTEEIEH